MLALLLLVHHAAASDIPKDTNYVTRQVASCPDTGFFFRQEVAPNSIEPLCYLCFCQDGGSATCWKRQNRRCDLKSYQVQKKNTRVRRSPLSLGELFVRDAAREFFNKQSPEQCKPYESSFSDGCPPVDWCIGCTVCDCDANGRWDCHILSFCPDKNGKRQMKKQKTPTRNRIRKGRSKSKKSVALPSTKNPPKNTTKKPIIKRNMRRNQVIQSRNQLKPSINNQKLTIKGTKVKKYATVKKTNSKLQARKSIPNNTKVTKNPLIIKKDISTSNPLNIKSSKVNQNNTVEVAQKVVKQFMSTVQKMMKNFEKKANSTTKPANKVINKRSMPKQDNKKIAKNLENKHMFRAKHISKSMKNRKQVSKKPSQKTTHKPQDRKQYKNGRNKRQVTINESISDFNISNYHQDNKHQDDINKTINFIDYSINTSTTRNSANEFFEVYAIPLNMDKELLILDNKTTDESENITRHNELSSNKVNNNTTSQSNNTESVNTTKLSASWILDNFTTPFDKQNNSRFTAEDMSNIIIDDASLSTNYMLYNITTITNRPKLTEYEYRNISKYETQTSKNDKNIINTIEQLRHEDNTSHTCKFRLLLEKLIAADGNNVSRPKKPKRYTIMTKIKRLFKKIFHRSMKSNLYRNENLHYDNFEPTSVHQKVEHCKLQTKDKYKLHQKFDLLRNESQTILKTIRIIKGLLQVLEINTNKSANVKFNDSYRDIGKLDAIMKNNYEDEEIVTKLSNDQRTQIKYIKENVHVFIKSMGNFATTLQDIIDIAKHHDENHKVIDTTIRNYDNLKLHNDFKNTKDTTKQKLEKLKRLLLNYNILQNTFVHQIYTILNNIGTNDTSKENLKPKAQRNHLEINKTNAIEANSDTIIKNIRKLKILAEKLNAQSRKKREAIGDGDAIEYLLILMEYLLKKHAPSHPPLNDGIDLLIDAIKSAPDIEPIRKKVLNYVPDRTIVTRTTSPTNSAGKDITYYKSKKNQEYSAPDTETMKTKTTESPNADEDDEDEEDDSEKIYQKFKSFKDSSSQQKEDPLDPKIDSTTHYHHHDKKGKSVHKSQSTEVRTKGINDNIDSTTFTSPNSATVQLEITTEYPTTVPSNVKVKEYIDDNFLVDAKANIDWIEANFKEIKQWKAVDQVSTTVKSVTRTRRNKVKNTNNLSDVTREIEDKRPVKPSAEVMTKKNNLLNAFDYAEKEIEDDVDSKEDKFISDTY